MTFSFLEIEWMIRTRKCKVLVLLPTGMTWVCPVQLESMDIWQCSSIWCVCMHLWRPEVDVKCHPKSRLHLHFEERSLTETGVHQLTRLPGKQGSRILLSLSPSSGVPGVHCHTPLLYGSWRSKPMSSCLHGKHFTS